MGWDDQEIIPVPCKECGGAGEFEWKAETFTGKSLVKHSTCEHCGGTGDEPEMMNLADVAKEHRDHKRRRAEKKGKREETK